MDFNSWMVLPFISSVKRDADALEMAQPSAVKATSFILLFFNFKVKRILSPQKGLFSSTSISGFFNTP